MLVIISDLHLTDGTSSNTAPDTTAPGGQRDLFNINPKAFRLFFADLAETVRRMSDVKAVNVVYAGDIFDVLRTYAWFTAAPTEVPWSDAATQEDVGRRCTAILDAICRHNAESLAWLSGQKAGTPFSDFLDIWPANVPITRTYLTGNHDRLVNQYAACRSLASQYLLGTASPTPLPNEYFDANHRTLVLHGHEADAFNCELDGGGRPDYDAMPIGDAMTTALFGRLGYEAEKAGLDPAVVAQLREVDNVRPLLEAVRLVQDVVSSSAARDTLTQVVRTVVSDFQHLSFFRAWREKHDGWGFDEADKLQGALDIIKLLGTHIPVDALEWLSGLSRGDECARLAMRRLKVHDADYCVLGHTHEALHAPVNGAGGTEKHYLNSGTFRSTLTRSLSGDAFVRLQRLSYVIVYGPGEMRPSETRPMWEMWSGMRRDI